jgi:GT2 family glycosyltransferase
VERSTAGATPFLSFIVPLTHGRDVDLAPLVDSLVAQWSHGWQLVVVGGGADAASRDPRIVVVARPDGGLPAAVAAGLSVATGLFVSLLGTGDTVAPELVERLEERAVADPALDVLYTDEAYASGERAFAKPSFSPERLRGQDYLGIVTAYRRELVDRIGGLRTGIAGAELYDLALRATREARSVGHVRGDLATAGTPSLQASWNPDAEASLPAVRRALEEHLAATGGGTVESVGADGIHRTHRPVHGSPLVSIVIPTRGSTAEVRGVDRCMVVEAVRGVVDLSTYENYEFVVVIDDVAEQSVRDELVAIAGERMRFVDWTGPFSFSGKMNLGVLHARGEYVLLLNDDVELITPGWIEALLALGQLPGAGLVGSMLYFDDETIQHAGHAYYRLDVTHIGLNSPRGAAGPHGGFLVEREVAGVTGACALMSKSLYLEAGGFSPLLPGNFNDVDLCMKVDALGYQSYWTPYAELYHFESKSRDPRVAAYEIRTAWGRWEHLFYDSPLWPTDPHEIFPSTSVRR